MDRAKLEDFCHVQCVAAETDSRNPQQRFFVGTTFVALDWPAKGEMDESTHPREISNCTTSPESLPLFINGRDVFVAVFFLIAIEIFVCDAARATK